MGIGNNIKEQRTKLGLTQKDVADKLNVTAQAVSRWENEDVEPSIDTLKQLSSLFNVSLDEFLNNDYTPEKVEPHSEEAVEEIPPAPVTAVSAEPMGVCTSCGKQYPTSQLKTRSRRGKGRHTEGPYCPNCWNAIQTARNIQKDYEAKEHAKKVSFRRILGYVLGLAAFAVLFGISVAMAMNSGDTDWMIVGAVAGVCAYFIIACALLGDNLVTNCFSTIAGFGIKFPGIIFTLDLNGIISFILIKILFGIISFIISGIMLIAACLISGAFAIIYYPYILVISYKHPEDIDFD
ncbi:MAG: helix-turn-helix domain-containing protein [Anaeroplasmataceae bacterium]|nr:helix-turn-helix domain-containing protein [Anaeroplasmataceae bacterium]